MNGNKIEKHQTQGKIGRRVRHESKSVFGDM